MKQLIQLLILLITCTVFAQKTDLINAPVNPIVLKYKLEHFGFKGDVFSYDSKYYFNKEGLLISKSDYEGDATYTYENGKLVGDGSYFSIEVNDQGYIPSYKSHKYTYNNKDLITTDFETERTLKYSYDALNRVIKKEEFKDDVLQTTTNYSYIKEGTVVKVFKKETENGKTVSSESRYKDGQLIYAKSNSDNIELKIEKKLDAKGNSVRDAYINNGNETDVFDYSIVYYSDANKPINYTMVMFKGYDGKLYQHVHRNGVYFSTKYKKQLNNTQDMLLYDDLTKNYYIAKNAYDPALTEGTVIKFELIAENGEAVLKILPDNQLEIYCYGKNIVLDSKESIPTLIFNNFFSYHVDKKTNKTTNLFFKDAVDKTFVGGILLPQNKENLYFIKSSKEKGFNVLKNGIVIRSTVIKQIPTEKGDLVVYFDEKTAYTLTNYYKAEDDVVHAGRLYDPKIDISASEKSQENDTEPTTPTTTCVSGNCIDGYGELKKTHSTLTGFFSEGKASGFGKEVFDDGSGFYEGTFKDGLRHGYGFYKWYSNEQYYIGQWLSGKTHGYGYVKKDAEVLQAGYYENGKQTRNMLTQNFVNKQAVGNCIGNCTDGFGFYQYANNDKYVGFFSNSKRHYVGAYTWVNGDAYMGEFNNGQLTGQASEFYISTGSTYYGTFSNGKRQGLGVSFYKSGGIESKGVWENGTIKTSY